MSTNATSPFDISSFLINFEQEKSKESKASGSARGFLQATIKEAEDILSFLISEYVNDCYIMGDDRSAEQMLLRSIRISPDNSLNWLAVATHKALHCNDLEGFRKYLKKALSVARKERSFYIQCNIDAVSVFIEFREFDEANMALKRVIRYKRKSIQKDSGYSTSYISRLKGIGLDDKLIDDYLEKFADREG